MSDKNSQANQEITTDDLDDPKEKQSGESLNPYWLAEEPEAHPDPKLGCIRRGKCCLSSPGWFGPGEVEKAAEAKGMATDDFVRKFLIIDAMEIEGERVEVFAPVKLDRFGAPAFSPATRVDELYRILRGRCVFYSQNGCEIYTARPIECRQYVCTNAPEDNPSHKEIAKLWLGESNGRKKKH